jgi:hypothetical protein
MWRCAMNWEKPMLDLSGTATIKNLNVRKENHGEEKVLAVDLKLEFQSLRSEYCDFFDPAAEAFLWRGEDDEVRNTFLAPIVYDVDVDNCVVKIGKQKFGGCIVKRFALEPRNGGVMNLGCHVIIHPGDTDVSKLAPLVQENAAVVIQGPPDLFSEG